MKKILHTNRDLDKIRIAVPGSTPYVWIIFDKDKKAEIDDEYADWFKAIPGFWIEEEEPIVILDYDDIDML